ncbi:TRADD-N-associated membrane domain-containing protein [Streptomyces sp. CA-243310]|uniref:TRADD-N-associated membrane domain-containing protein n=1 Tax=Streptomyces sp. CA-243310 TaxID=3240056 RepID=UPI003D911AAE
MGEWVVAGVAVLVACAVYVVAERASGAAFERRRDAERARLLARTRSETDPEPEARDPKYGDTGWLAPRTVGPAQSGERHDDFTPLLVEYYAYGLTQARSSFVTSQRFAGAGATILLLGVALAVWKAESSGDLYLGVVTSSVGLVVTLIGQLFHRRADIALRHMADQTASLRDDRRAAESMVRAVGLLEEVADPELKGRLQAGLIMKLSGAELPR